MRFKSKYALADKLGAARIVKKFLLWPRRFNSKNWRWLSKEEIVERVEAVDVGGSMEWGNYAYKWCEIGFADETPNNKASRWNEYAHDRHKILKDLGWRIQEGSDSGEPCWPEGEKSK